MKKNSLNNTKRLIILPSVIFLMMCSFTYLLGKGLNIENSLGATSPSLILDIKATKVTISPSSKTIDINETLTLKATITPTNTTNKSIKWESSSPTVASVNSSGVVTGKKAGTTIITATSTNGITGSARITVTSKVSPTQVIKAESVVVAPTSRTINVGTKLSLIAVISPNNVTDKTITWTSNNTSVATVSTNGIVTGKSAGTAVITATTSNNKKATSIITVNSGSVTPTTYTLTYNNTGGSGCGSKTATSGNAWGTLCTPTRSGYTFKMWNTKADGTGTTVTTSTKASSNITVYAQWTKNSNSSTTIPVTNVSLDHDTLSLEIGEQATLHATITPNNATNKGVTWVSSDTSVVIVNNNGVVTAKSSGTAEVTVRTNDGGKEATAYITVNKKSEPIIIDEPSSFEEPSSKEEPSIYVPDEKTESNVNSRVLIIGLVALTIFIIGTVTYFVVKRRRSNFV